MAKAEVSLQDITNSVPVSDVDAHTMIPGEKKVAVSVSEENQPNVSASTSNAWFCEILPLDTGATCTRVLVPGDPNAGKQKLPCPVAGCSERLFPARDMYYLKRHFLHDHSASHPNPVFITVCPVEHCRQHCGQTLEELRKHLIFAHPDSYRHLISARFTHQNS